MSTTTTTGNTPHAEALDPNLSLKFKNLLKRGEIPFVMKNDENKSFNLFLKAAEEIYQAALSYEDKKEESFILFYRFINLYINIISKNKLFKEEPYKERCKNLKKLNFYVFDKIEKLKKEIILDYLNQQDLKNFNSKNFCKENFCKENFCNNGNQGNHLLQNNLQKNNLQNNLQNSLNKPEIENNNFLIFSNYHNNIYENTLQNNTLQNNNLNSLQQNTLQNNLKPIYINEHLIDDFLNLSNEYTKKGIEFCGIFAGQLIQEKYFTINYLFIPKQENTPNSCKAINELEILNILDDLNQQNTLQNTLQNTQTLQNTLQNNEIISIGWIHTHPIQNAFLSSIDLRTHFGYQTTLKESFAMVFSKMENKISTFRIKDEYSNNNKDSYLNGMEKLKFIFRENIYWGMDKHEYLEEDEILYENCKHVFISYDYNIPYQIIDKR
ncbi:hypothetical protein ABK040_001020 [Willaertia magna]